VGSAGFGDARGCPRSHSRGRSGAQLGPAGGAGQRAGLGDSGRAAACLGRARRTTAACRGAATAATAAATPSDDPQPRRACADLGRAGSRRVSSTHRLSGSDLGRCSPGPTTAAGARAILGPTGSRRAGSAAGPHLGLARARAFAVGAASAAVMGCPQARSPTPARGTVVGQ